MCFTKALDIFSSCCSNCFKYLIERINNVLLPFLPEYAKTSPAWKPVKDASTPKEKRVMSSSQSSTDIASRDASASPRKEGSVSWSRSSTALGENTSKVSTELFVFIVLCYIDFMTSLPVYFRSQHVRFHRWRRFLKHKSSFLVSLVSIIWATLVLWTASFRF